MQSRPSYPAWPSGPGLPHDGEEIDGRYRLGELLGIGGMGAVFEAEEIPTGHRVAIKVLRPEETQTTDATQRFMREARAASTIQSPHVCRVLGMGKLDNALPYMVLELLEGNRLDTVIRELAPLPVPAAVDYLLQACEGLAAAHALGFIHRDLKPSNLFVTRGPDGRDFVKVLDFGIAKATGRLDPNSDAMSLTESSSTLGSPQYMSPEQLRCSKNVDARTDLWPLGLILHKMLTGRSAYEADSVGAQFAMIVSDPPTPLRAHRADLPEELERIVACCLEKKPEHRYQDVGQLAEALLPFCSEGAQARVARIRAILDRAGVSSPRLPAERVAEAIRDATLSDQNLTQAWRRDDGGATARSWDASRRSMAPRRSKAPWVVAAAAGVVVLLAAGSYGWWKAAGRGDPAIGAEPEASNTAAATGEGAASAVATVRIELKTEPEDAQVFLDGALTRDNPITLPQSDRVHEIVVKAPGHVAVREEVSAERDSVVQIRLKKEEDSRPPRARPGRVSKPAHAAKPEKPDEKPKSGPAEIKPKGPWSDDL